MLSKLKASRKLVGLNQCRKAVKDESAAVVFVAEDTDNRIKQSLLELCKANNVETYMVPTMKELGMACGIEVGASAAVLLK